MKKTINGLRYDTENAIFIGEYYNGNDVNAFSYWEASLYKTKRSSRFFLAGSGGPMTEYASEALKWAEQYLDQEKIDEYFFDLIEDA